MYTNFMLVDLVCGNIVYPLFCLQACSGWTSTMASYAHNFPAYSPSTSPTFRKVVVKTHKPTRRVSNSFNVEREHGALLQTGPSLQQWGVQKIAAVTFQHVPSKESPSRMQRSTYPMSGNAIPSGTMLSVMHVTSAGHFPSSKLVAILALGAVTCSKCGR
jgi:hypothetical protein